MRKIIILLLLGLTSSVSFAQFFSENWDNPALWRTRDLDSDSPASIWAPLDLSAGGAPLNQFGNAIVSGSFGIDPDDLVISPLINISTISGNMKMIYQVAAVAGVTDGEHYSVYVVTDTTNIATSINGLTPIFAETITTGNTIFDRELDLTNFVGGSQIFIIFRHHLSQDETSIVLDNIHLLNASMNVNSSVGCVGSTFTFADISEGTYSDYIWDFGADATPATATGPGPHSVTYAAVGAKTVVLTNPAGHPDITGEPGDTNVMTIDITDNPVPVFTASETVGCTPMTVEFVSSNQSTNCSFSFSDGITANSCTVTRTFTEAGTYDVTLTETIDAACFGSTTQNGMITVYATPTPAFSIVNNPVDFLYPQVSFINESPPQVTGYTWLFGDGSAPSTAIHPTHLYPQGVAADYTVSLISTSANSCDDTVNLVVKVQESVLIFIPNSFTPNGDELNNRFEPNIIAGVDPQDYNMKIFNRLGELVFESNDPEIGWDGDYGAGRGLAQTGVYTYKIEFSTKENDEKRRYIGHVNLIR
ncbi:MAG: T9SS type B sorting domain-containing protein [Bacteroidetes bacterium]|nr:MAG: T9SS type B sorting domain-containing protein [Bacteroidota bacterium]